MVKETETDEKSSKVAEHELLNSAGESPDDLKDEGDAAGVRYTLLGNKQSITVMWDELSPKMQRAAGLFGIKTRLTNDTSGVRNQKKNGVKIYEEDFDRQIQAARDSVEDWKKEIWVDRTREPGAPRIDRDKLAEAIGQVMLASGKITQEQLEATVAERRAKLDSDPAYLSAARAFPAVGDVYNKLTGRKTIDLNDL